MNSDKRIEELYNSTFKEVHAPDELKGMVEKMADNKKIIWKRLVRKAATVAAVVAVAFATGNFATYAATGDNLINFVNVKINEKKADPEKDIKMEKKVDEDGRIYYYGKIKSKSGDAEVKIYDNVEASIGVNDIEDIDTENGKVSGSELKIILKPKK